MRLAAYLVSALLAWALPAAAPAQPQPGADMNPAQCDQLARMPNPPMTAETCRAMLNSAAAMRAAQTSPEGIRPGDEAMSCDEITAEMKTQQVQGPSQEHLAEGQAAGADLRAKMDEAKRTARPNQRNPEQERSLAGAAQRTTAANAATTGDMAAQMQANPRFARLVGLAGEKQCRGDF